MPAISDKTLEQALLRIQNFRNQLDFDLQADRILDGTLHELSVHFLQRAMPNSYCFDLDFIVLGFKDNEPFPKALIEIKTKKGNLSINQKKIYQQIANSLDIPFYLLTFYHENMYWITRLDTETELGFFEFNDLTKWFQDISHKPKLSFGEEKKEDFVGIINLQDVYG